MPEDVNALDRELSELLAVQPSPEFAAKVRMRIEQQPTRSMAWRWWVAGAIVAAAVLVIAVAAGFRTSSPVALAVHARADLNLPLPRHDDGVSLDTAVPPRAVAVHASKPTPEPETLVDPSLAAAVRRLASNQRVLPEMPAEASLDPVVVEPLKVPEIAESGAKEGDRQ